MQKNKINERYRWPISDAALEQRLRATQSYIKKENLDAVVIQTQNAIFDRGIRYYLDTQAHGYASALLIPAVGEMVYVSSGGENYDAPIPSSLKNVRKMITLPYCPPFQFTDSMAGRALADEIRSAGYKRIGLYQKQSMSMAFGQTLESALPDVVFTDASEGIYRLSAVKSDEEWELIRKSLRVHEQIIGAVPALLRPSKLESTLQAELEWLALDMGCDTIGNLSVGSAPRGQNAVFMPRVCENRRIQEGDVVTVMVEAAGPGGVFCELARSFCMGQPSDNLTELYAIAREAQRIVAGAAKPGVSGEALNRIYNEFIASYGLPANNRFVGHGQGYDMMESPAICPGETMTLERDMFLAIHPELVRNGEFAICCDNFRVTDEGAIRETRTPQEIICVEF